MIIEGPDFRIECDDRSYTLFLLKNKKENKEIKDDDKFRVAGYYISFISMLKAIIKFRKSKKYSGSEKPSDIIEDLEEFKTIKNQLNSVLNYSYDPIIKLKNVILYND